MECPGGELAGAVHQQRHELLLRLRLGGGAGHRVPRLAVAMAAAMAMDLNFMVVS